MEDDSKPMQVIASRSRWHRPDGTTTPVVTVTNGRSRIMIDPRDLPSIARVMLTVMEQAGRGDAS